MFQLELFFLCTIHRLCNWGYHDSCLSWDRINTTCSTHRLSIYCVYVSLVMFCLADANSIVLPYFGVTELKENTPAQSIFLLRFVPLCRAFHRDESVDLILKTRGTRFWLNERIWPLSLNSNAMFGSHLQRQRTEGHRVRIFNFN